MYAIGNYRGSKVLQFKNGPVQVVVIEGLGNDGLPETQRIYGNPDDFRTYFKSGLPMDGENITVPVRIDAYQDKKGIVKQTVRLQP